MLNYLWAGMTLLGIMWAVCHGNMDAVTNGILDSSKEAVNLAVSMVGMMSFWCGILHIGETSGLVHAMTQKIKPLIRIIFPKLPQDHPAEEHISMNMIANILGLGWAATPAGLRAMKELLNLERERGNTDRLHIASNEMCTFMVINISSLQLIPINMIAYRNQYGSMNPAAFVGPVIIATSISTLTGLLFSKFMSRNEDGIH